MSLHHLAQRLSVKRENTPPIGFIDDFFDIFTAHNLERTKQSQNELNAEKFTSRYTDYHKRKSLLSKNRYWENHEKMKAIKRERSKIFRLEKPEKAKEYAKKWRDKNPERVKASHKKAHQKRKDSMTHEQYKLWMREKNRKAKERKIAQIGIEAYRAAANTRLKKHYAKKKQESLCSLS